LFYPFDLVFETNKLIGSFEVNGFKIITEIMAEFKNPKIRVMFAQLLHDFNTKIKIVDDFLKDILLHDEAIRRELEVLIEEKFLDRLYSMMNVIMFEMKYNFAQLYDHSYWDKMYSFVKELWTAMPEDKSVYGAKKGFKHLFEDFHDHVVMKYPSLFVKELRDVGSMYRCRSWSVNDDYELMVPNEQYVKDNRWNPDGVAYLYLACGDANESYDGIVNMVQKTSFEEVRLKDGSEVAICQFKPIMKDAKIIDLCFEGIDISKLSRELKVPPEEYPQTILDAINDSPHLTQLMIGLAQVNTKDDFLKKTDPYLKQLIKDTGLDKKNEEIVYSRTSTILLGLIDESIFEVVDKTDDPELKAYLPFRAFSRFLIEKGYNGIIYRSTRMNKIGLSGKNLVLFDKIHATYNKGTMKKYKYSSGKYIELS
jgi:hypothetical protein